MAKDLPYFITWTKQRGTLTFDLEGVTKHELISSDSSGTNDKTKAKLKIYDFSSMSYQASFGLKNKFIEKAITKQLGSFSLALPKNTFPLKNEVASRLNEKAKRFTPTKKIAAEYKTFFTLSGSEGIENALKMVRQQTGRNIILARKRSYHGATMGSLAVTGDWRNERHVLPRQWTVRIPGPLEDPKGESIEKIILKTGASRIAAFCLETITGGNGVLIPAPAYYKKVQALAKKYKIKIIMDEVVCAFHRTGTFFGIDHYPFLRPDFIVLSKAITGGFIPFGAVLVEKKMAKFYDREILSCGLTNYAHPLGLAATQACLDLCDDQKFRQNLDRLIELMNSFAKRLQSNDSSKKNIKTNIKTRNIGMLMAIELDDKLDKLIDQKSLLEEGLYLSKIGKNLILAPHLTETPTGLNKKLKQLEKILNSIA